ncbi:MetQ/NlpA family ABC transporter substrate-binding protein [Corynebacterium striatum]|uniref:MetQ/NlpA family ABC transporter substrate-binding protein n=1 Tax=Corynebacterium striatum TaxID=43770 RepID=UPI0034D79421|nr:methionine ABC transporter substrate-binding protein [Corynebacterium striatum]HCD3161031.1 methionine ABC transporter substrate-binding protein [Corynebacterium striatum]HCD3683122.1 methionine ABC transporter substrate-binding protein [Corynebacterium striatum]HCD4755720.1 methionine ABC transporter substrate-binding protein [Corynebacterium striatum]HCD5913812.1 methionine ABC transporter substrate-binding protein [Corynebacterium striatum]
MQIRKIVAVAAASVVAATGLVACSSSDSSEFAAGTAEDPIVIGTTDAELPEWGVLKDLAAKEGIEIEMKSFTDYATPNQSLAEGSTDTNKFQHLKFLAEYNKGNGTNLVPVASTQVYPMPLFWKGHQDIKGIEGQEIAIPNDSTNQGRAINLLAANDLLVLKEKGKLTPDPADIDEEKSKVKVTPVDASQTPSAFGEGKPAIITNSFFKRAHINPADAVLYDDPEAPSADPEIMFDPYINVWAVQEKDKDNEKVKRLAELYLSDEVKAAVQDTTGGTTIFVDRPQAELQEILDRLEETTSK